MIQAYENHSYKSSGNLADAWETSGQIVAKHVTILHFLYFPEKNWWSPTVYWGVFILQNAPVVCKWYWMVCVHRLSSWVNSSVAAVHSKKGDKASTGDSLPPL